MKPTCRFLWPAKQSAAPLENRAIPRPRPCLVLRPMCQDLDTLGKLLQLGGGLSSRTIPQPRCHSGHFPNLGSLLTVHQKLTSEFGVTCSVYLGTPLRHRVQSSLYFHHVVFFLSSHEFYYECKPKKACILSFLGSKPVARCYTFLLSDSCSCTTQSSVVPAPPLPPCALGAHRRAGESVQGSLGRIVDFVILAQSLGRTWDLPSGTPAGPGLPAGVCWLSPRAFGPVQGGVMSPGHSLGAGQQSGRRRMNTGRGVGCPPSSGLSSLPPQPNVC